MEKVTGPKARLRQYARYKDLSNNEFTNNAGLSNGYLTLDGPLYTDSLLKISVVFRDLNLEWVITGKGHMLNPPLSAADFSYPILKEDHIFDKLEELKTEHPESIEVIQIFESEFHSYSRTIEMLIENCKSKDLIIENQSDKIKLLEDKLFLIEKELSKKKNKK